MTTVQTRPIKIDRIERDESGEFSENTQDFIAIEEPLEIRIGANSNDLQEYKCLSLTMRTPGNDVDLTLGFLWTEGIITNYKHVNEIGHCGNSGNIIRVTFIDSMPIDWSQLNRHFYMTSSCGVCGKTSIEALRQKSRFSNLKPLKVFKSVVYKLPQKILETQVTFSKTGGLHAASLFDRDGKLIEIKEDVGRHNALDKLIGACLQKTNLPLDQQLLVLSGRASFELIQKAYMAGLQIIVAIGAPSSLAVELAKEVGITLIGFTKANRYNVYSGMHRLGEENETAN